MTSFIVLWCNILHIGRVKIGPDNKPANDRRETCCFGARKNWCSLPPSLFAMKAFRRILSIQKITVWWTLWQISHKQKLQWNDKQAPLSDSLMFFTVPSVAFVCTCFNIRFQAQVMNLLVINLFLATKSYLTTKIKANGEKERKRCEGREREKERDRECQIEIDS